MYLRKRTRPWPKFSSHLVMDMPLIFYTFYKLNTFKAILPFNSFKLIISCLDIFKNSKLVQFNASSFYRVTAIRSSIKCVNFSAFPLLLCSISDIVCYICLFDCLTASHIADYACVCVFVCVVCFGCACACVLQIN